MTPTIDLSRSEIARLADVLDLLVQHHGGPRRAARKTADTIGVAHETMGKILQRPAALRVTPATLKSIALAAGEALGITVTADELRRGALHLPPAAARGQGAGR